MSFDCFCVKARVWSKKYDVHNIYDYFTVCNARFAGLRSKIVGFVLMMKYKKNIILHFNINSELNMNSIFNSGICIGEDNLNIGY